MLKATILERVCRISARIACRRLPAQGGFRGVALAFVETSRADEMSLPDTGAHFRGAPTSRGPLSMGFHYLPYIGINGKERGNYYTWVWGFHYLPQIGINGKWKLLYGIYRALG